MAKKSGAKKTEKKAAGRSSKKTVSRETHSAGENKKLIERLNSLASGLGQEALLFLIRQAEVLRHNAPAGEEHGLPARDPRLEKYQSPTPTDKYTVAVREGEDGSFFVVAVNSARNFFALDEMRALVKLCHAAENEKDAGERLFNWFSREKGEVIKNTKITGPGDPALKAIYAYIINTYTVRE